MDSTPSALYPDSTAARPKTFRLGHYKTDFSYCLILVHASVTHIEQRELKYEILIDWQFEFAQRARGPNNAEILFQAAGNSWQA
jgi:hypothetical protein